MDIFEQASREAVRFVSVRGALATELLWHLPLTAKDGFSMDCVAKAVNSEVKALAEESFVETKANPAKAQAELKLKIIKYIIADRLEQNAKANAAASRKAEKESLLAALAQKQEGKRQEMSEEELQKRIAELS